MNGLGYPLEQFDDFGRFRTEESLEHPKNLVKAGNGKTTADVFKTKPLDSTGILSGTGDPKLDGPVKDSFDLIDSRRAHSPAPSSGRPSTLNWRSCSRRQWSTWNSRASRSKGVTPVGA
jgi:hypothetical protein